MKLRITRLLFPRSSKSSACFFNGKKSSLKMAHLNVYMYIYMCSVYELSSQKWLLFTMHNSLWLNNYWMRIEEEKSLLIDIINDN